MNEHGTSQATAFGFIDALPDLTCVVDGSWNVVADNQATMRAAIGTIAVDELLRRARLLVQLSTVASSWVHVTLDGTGPVPDPVPDPVVDAVFSVRSSPLDGKHWLVTIRPVSGRTMLDRLQGAQTQFGRVVNALPMGLAGFRPVLSEAGELVDVVADFGNAMASEFGAVMYARGGAPGATHDDLVNMARQAWTTGEEQTVEVALDRDGQRCFYLWSLIRVDDRLLGVITDVSEMARNRIELADATAQFKATLDALDVGVIRFTVEQVDGGAAAVTPVYWNKASERVRFRPSAKSTSPTVPFGADEAGASLTGVDRWMELGTPLSETMPPDVVALALGTVEQSPTGSVHRTRLDNRRRLFGHGTASVFDIATTRVGSDIVSLFTDRTVEVEAIELLAASEEQHRLVLDSLEERICLMEPVMNDREVVDLRVVAVNRAQAESNGGMITPGALASEVFTGGRDAKSIIAARTLLAGGTVAPYRVERGSNALDDVNRVILEVRAVLAGQLILLVGTDRTAEVALEAARDVENAVVALLPQSLTVLRAVRDGDGEIDDLEIVYVNAVTSGYFPEGTNPVGRRLSEVLDNFRSQWLPQAQRLVERGRGDRIVVNSLDGSNAFLGVRYIEFEMIAFGDQVVVIGSDRTEREQLNRRLRATSDQLAAVYDALPSPVILFDSAGLVESMNEAAIAAFPGHSLARVEADNDGQLVIGALGLEATLPDGTPLSTADRWDMIRGGGGWVNGSPVHVVTPRGRAFDFLAKTMPVPLSDGRDGFLVSLVDITDLAAANAAVAVAEAQLREIIDSLGEGVLLLSPDRDTNGSVIDATVVLANPSAAKMFSIDGGLVGSRLSDIFVGHSGRAVGGVREAMAGTRCTYSFSRGDQDSGSQRFEFGEVSFYPTSGGLVVAMVTDRSEQHHADAQQRRTSELLASTLAHLANGLAIFEPVLDADGTLVDGSLTFENAEMRRLRMVGDVPTTSMTGYLWGLPLIGWSRAAWSSVDVVRAQIDNRAGQCPDLQCGEYAVTVVKAGEVLVCSIVDETTERDATRRLEMTLNQLVEVADAERRTLAVALHDGAIQSLIAARIYVIGMQAATADGPHAPDVAMIAKALDAAIDELRDQTFELFPPSLEMSGLPAAVGDLLERFAVDGPQMRLVDHLGDRRLPSTIERLAYRTAQELLRNVLKHAKSTSVDLSIMMDSDMLRLDVVDDGRGFDPEADVATTSFGLVSCRHLLELAGGSLTIASRPGEGTHATALLPVAGVERRILGEADSW